MNSKLLVNKIRDIEKKYASLNQDELKKETETIRKQILNGKNENKFLPQAFALVSIAAGRVLNMTPFDVQFIGGIALHNGKIAEMKTGEGKTLVAVLPVFLNALSGKGVHVITVNDYLAKRDSAQMGEVFKYLGLTCGCIYSNMPFDERKKAYQCDVTYGTNSEFGFDYLRDNLAKTTEQVVQRGLNYAIIDEVDSILIDDSKTPLIISGKSKNNADIFESVDKAVKTLKKTTNYSPDATLVDKITRDEEYNGDYILMEKTKEVILTDSGIKKIESILGQELSDSGSLLSHYVSQSLKANYAMNKDIDYVVKDGKIMIVDGSTGRIMESRKYSDSLHQAIEAKEGVTVTEENVTQGTITYQNFFRMYNKICGMTGTAYTDKYEFKTIYGLKVEVIPTNRPVIRIDAPDMLFPTKNMKYQAIAEKIKELHEKGQPILIGTPSVEESEIIASMLRKEGYPFNLLNAKNHEKEAEIIAQAGAYGAITVATNMAGRGTDILLGGNPVYEINQYKQKVKDGELTEFEFNNIANDIKKKYIEEHNKVVDIGGLAVIGAERFDNRRIDDQLRGRAGRQGDPGFSQFFLSMEDKMLRVFSNITTNEKLDYSCSTKLNEKLIRNAQKQIENLSFSARKNTLDYDDVNDSQRKQVYNIRNDVMRLDDNGILALFEKYKKEVCITLSKSEEDVSKLFHHGKPSGKSADALCSFIDGKMEENTNILKQYDETIVPMIRYIMLMVIDKQWIDYINQTISLKETVGITTMGSLKPLQLYKMQSVKLFNFLIWNIKQQIICDCANIRIHEKTEIKVNLD